MIRFLLQRLRALLSIQGMLMYAGHAWGVVAGAAGAFGLWSGSGLVIAGAIIAALVSASQFNQDRAERGRLED